MVNSPSVALGKGTLCRVQWALHSAKLETEAIFRHFPSFVECRGRDTRQRISKKINALPSAEQEELGKEFNKN
jgi:hypothetical protein